MKKKKNLKLGREGLFFFFSFLLIFLWPINSPIFLSPAGASCPGAPRMRAIAGARAHSYCAGSKKSLSRNGSSFRRVITCSSSSLTPDSPALQQQQPKKKMPNPAVDVAAAAFAAAALSSDGTESAAATPRFQQQQQQQRDGGGSGGPALVVFSGGTAFNSVAGESFEFFF